MKKKTKLTIMIAVFALLLIVVGVSYAYFSAQITGNESGTTITTTAGTLNVVFNGGSNITASNVYPQTNAVATKTFTVTGTNTTSLAMPYTLTLVMDTNTLSTGALTYTLTSTNTSSNGTVVPSISTQTSIKTGSSTITLGSGYFANGTNSVHTYVLNIYFPSTESNQNADQGKSFTAHVGIVGSATGVPDGWNESTSGTLLYALKISNSVTTPLTTPGQQLSTETESELSSAADDYGISYYFRGNVTNNYVVFANMCWRIVRVTGDGSVKLVLYNYNSTDCTITSDNTAAFARYSGTTYKSIFNTNFDDNAYIGFMYGTAGASTYATAHANTNSSTIKTNLETWYTSKLASYSSNLADTIWCSDKSMDTVYPYNGQVGYGISTTYYSALARIFPNHDNIGATASPTLVCNSQLGSYTVDDAINGNGALTDKIGLLTADEIAYAGGIWVTVNQTYYLYSNSSGAGWWSLTPGLFDGGGANIFVLDDGGYFNLDYVTESLGIRPVVSLKSTTMVTGSGTASNPYVVS